MFSLQNRGHIKNKSNQTKRTFKLTKSLPSSTTTGKIDMNLQLASFAFTSMWHSAHGEVSSYLHGNIVDASLSPVVAGGIDAGIHRLSGEVENPHVLEQGVTCFIGGLEAIKDCFSYVVCLQSELGKVFGGSPIARAIVLTMANCAFIPSVVLGKHNINNGDGKVFDARVLAPYPEYSATTLDNNFMLLFLDSASIAKNIITVKLNSSPLVPSVDQDVTAMG
jgi:hypothetical protein